METRLNQWANRVRKEHRVPPLVFDEPLAKVARRYARVLGTHHLLRHRGPKGDEVADRLRRAGIVDWDRVGENLEYHTIYRYRSYREDGTLFTAVCFAPEELAREIVQEWLNSPGHRRNLLDPDFTHLGTGVFVETELEAVYAVQIYRRKVSCGYPSGPCCRNPRNPSWKMCQVPFHCVDDRCE